MENINEVSKSKWYILKNKLNDFAKKNYFGNHIYHVDRKLITGKITTNPALLIKSLINSSDTNTANLGYFLSSLVYQFHIKITNKMIQIILNNLEVDIFDNPLYKNNCFDYYQALCYSHVIKKLSLTGQHLSFIDFFNKIISGHLNYNEEFNILINFVENHIDNNPDNALNIVCNAYRFGFKNGDKKEVLNNLRKMLFLIEMYHVKFIKTKDGSYYNPNNNTINIKENESILIVFHEFGHMIDHYLRDKKETFDEKFALFRMHATYYPYFEKEICELEKEVLVAKKYALASFRDFVNKNYGSEDNLLKIYQDYINYMFSIGKIDEVFNSYHIKKETCDLIMDDYYHNGVNIYQFAMLLYKTDTNKYINKYVIELEASAVMDIISAVFKSRKIVINNHLYELSVSHDAKYYEDNKKAFMNEIMADYNILKVMNRHDLINRLANIFGKEFIDLLESEYGKKYPSGQIKRS